MRILHLEGTEDAWTFRRFGRACNDLGVKPRHVLHVGGHLGQEVPHYRAAGVELISYMEPDPVSAMHLRDHSGADEVVQAAAGPGMGQGSLALCGGDGAWNTLRLDIGQGAGVHEAQGRITVDVLPISEVQRRHSPRPDVLVVDTQGTEVQALSSADLGYESGLQLVIVETQSSGHPEAAHVLDVDAFMRTQGWVPVLAWNHEHKGRPHETFADVFYLPTRERPT